MTSRFGFNFICDAPGFDEQKALVFLDQLRPAWVVVINNVGFAKTVAARLPDTNVIVRWVKKDNDPLKSWPSPHDFIDFAKREIGDTRLYANVANEAGFSDAVLKYQCDVIDQSGNLRLAVGGFSAGTPEPQDWKRPQAVELLKRLDAQRSRLVLNLHEYMAAVPTSGMANPPPVQPEDWPRDLSGVTCWHLGRFRFLIRACQDLQIGTPRIVIGEFGHDDLSDVKPWLDSLIKTPPYPNIRAWKSLVNQFNAWYGSRGWDAERTVVEHYGYADEVIYSGFPVEGLCDFAWCSPQSEWSAFDKSQAVEFQTRLVERDAAVERKYEPGDYTSDDATYNVRAEPRQTADKVGQLLNGETVKVLSDEPQTDGSYTWLRIEVRPGLEGAFTGWIADDVKLKVFTSVPADLKPILQGLLQAVINDHHFLAQEHEKLATWHTSQAQLHLDEIEVLLKIGNLLGG